MIAALRNLYQKVRGVISRTVIKRASFPVEITTEESSQEVASATVIEPTGTLVNASVSEPESPKVETASESPPAPAGLEGWSVHPYTDPTFEKIGRVYLDTGDLIIRSDRDTRGFLVVTEDLDAALTGGTGTVRLLDSLTTVGTAHLSTSGLALNLVIEGKLHTVPMRSLTPVLTGHHRKAPLFVPAEDLAPD